ncbi:MAG TPA: response regulator transcription factor [Hanamia sp.]|nr:response regulator transcription factor [Hanamia sp.]
MKKLIAVSVVEDIDEIRTRLKSILDESEEFMCTGAYSKAEDACNELAEVMPDIVLMDINLPGMSGIECMRKVKSIAPQILFMMFTIYEDSEQVFEALTAGASGYLLKKTPPEQLKEALKELFEGGSPMSAQIARKVVTYFQKKGEPQNDEESVLSPREREVLELLSKGFLYKEIANKLSISTGTVRQHIHKIYDKLHVQNRTEALNKFYGHR